MKYQRRKQLCTMYMLTNLPERNTPLAGYLRIQETTTIKNSFTASYTLPTPAANKIAINGPKAHATGPVEPYTRDAGIESKLRIIFN